jgi:uncharacterized protein (TIGR02246 family)
MTDRQPIDPADRAVDDRDLRALFDRMCAAWTAGDAEDYAACFTEDCDYVSFDGYRAHGRESVVTSHGKLFAGVLYGSALVGEVDDIRHLDGDVAVVHATGSVRVAWRRKLPRRRLTRNTITAVRTPDGWLAAAIHNGRIRPVGVPEPDGMLGRVARGLVRTTGALGIGR